MRDTEYATAITTATDAVGPSIEIIVVKAKQKPETRFSRWPDGKMALRPMNVAEDEGHLVGDKRAVRSAA